MTTKQLIEWGYSSSCAPKLCRLWNDVIKDNFEIKTFTNGQRDANIIVISDEAYDTLKESSLYRKYGMAKSLCCYTNHAFKDLFIRGEYIVSEKVIQNFLNKQTEKKCEEQNKNELFQSFKQECIEEGIEWRDMNWIRQNIGEYYTEEIYLEGFWTRIGNNYKKIDWKGDIELEENVYFMLKNNKNYKKYLTRKFKVGGYSHEIKGYYTEGKKEIKNENKIGTGTIYKIIIDNELVYIGKTMRKPHERFAEHIECCLNPEEGGYQQKYLYKAMRECQVGYKFEIIYQKQGVTNREIEEIEKVLIENSKPKYNYEGVKVPYRFSEEKK